MNVYKLHPWKVSTHEAAEIQHGLRERIEVSPLNLSKVKYVAGADVSFSKHSDDIYAAGVVLRTRDNG